MYATLLLFFTERTFWCLEPMTFKL
uniref:Uncharacterized protein n=1 Tax=Rhizophora mucronata TaxID=61149 RepID=A0A2P2PGJ7_RHIMU